MAAELSPRRHAVQLSSPGDEGGRTAVEAARDGDEGGVQLRVGVHVRLRVTATDAMLFAVEV